MSGIYILILRIAMAAALYLFLFWAFQAIWKNLRPQKQHLTEEECLPEIRIRTPDKKLHTFNQQEIIIGRDVLSNLQVQDDTISLKHARIYFTQGHCWVEDLGSTNQTLLNQQVLETASILLSGDVLQLGNSILEVEMDETEAEKI